MATIPHAWTWPRSRRLFHVGHQSAALPITLASYTDGHLPCGRSSQNPIAWVAGAAEWVRHRGPHREFRNQGEGGLSHFSETHAEACADDMDIAGIGYAIGTGNTRDFNRIQGLEVISLWKLPLSVFLFPAIVFPITAGAGMIFLGTLVWIGVLKLKGLAIACELIPPREKRESWRKNKAGGPISLAPAAAG